MMEEKFMNVADLAKRKTRADLKTLEPYLYLQNVLATIADVLERFNPHGKLKAYLTRTSGGVDPQLGRPPQGIQDLLCVILSERPCGPFSSPDVVRLLIRHKDIVDGTDTYSHRTIISLGERTEFDPGELDKLVDCVRERIADKVRSEDFSVRPPGMQPA